MKKIFLYTVVLSVILLSCAKSKQKPNKPQNKKKKETLSLATISDPKTFNIILANETSSTQILNLVYEGITDINGTTGEVVLNLADTYSVFDNGKRYRFYLKKNIKFNNNEELTSEDIKFTLENIIYNDTIPNSLKDILTVEGKKLKANIIDSKTVDFILPAAYAPFLRMASFPILPKKQVEAYLKNNDFSTYLNINCNLNDIIGCGPYKVEKYIPGSTVILKKNKYYHKYKSNQHLPLLKKIIFYIVADQDVALLKFKNNEIDAISLSPENYKYLESIKNKNYKLYDCGPSLGESFICLNMNKKFMLKNPKRAKLFKLFSNKEFRHSIMYAIDRENINKNLMFGLASIEHSPISPAVIEFYNKNVRKYKYNPEKSRKILDKLGLKDINSDGYREFADKSELEIDLLTNSGNKLREEMGTIIKEDLKNVGIKINFAPVQFNSLVTKLMNTYDWEAALIGLTGSVEPNNGKNVWMSSGHMHIWNPLQKKPLFNWEQQIDELFIKGVKEMDKNKRRGIYYKWQEIVAEQMPLIYLLHTNSLYAVRMGLKNIKPSSIGGVLHNIDELYWN